MLLNPLHALLMALADPRGPRPAAKGPPAPARLRELVELADWHGVLPAVIQNLRQWSGLAPGSWPAHPPEAEGWEWARQRLWQRTAFSLVLRGQAEEILACLRQAALPALILKGCDFAERLYPHPSLRPFTDVDLLVPAGSLPGTREVLTRLGYRPAAASMKYQNGYGEESWHPSRSGGTVELHWNLVNSPTLRRGISLGYEDLQLEQEAGRSRPSPAARLLIAAVHGVASHGLDRLQGLADLTQAVRGAAGALDEAWLAQAASRTGAGRVLAVALGVAHKIFREPGCRELLQRLGLRRKAWLGHVLLSRGVVLRAHASRDSFRRQLLRQLLKRP